MNSKAAWLVAVGSLSCTELGDRWNDHGVIFGSVHESEGGATLTTFCAETPVERSELVVFSAAAGTMVEEEVFVEGRTERYKGGEEAPDRDASFWCSDVPELYVRPTTFWACLRVADEDPPATIMAIEPRGEIALSGASSGYALMLQVQHPGVLRVIFDAQCVSDASDSTIDAGMPVAHGELTIQ